MKLTLSMIILLCSTLRVNSQSNYKNTPLPKNINTENGYFVKYSLVSDTSYIISWGNKKFHRNLDEKTIGADAWYPRYEYSNDSVIILRAGCGNPCWYALILPLNKNKQIRRVDFPEGYDMKNNLIVYLGNNDTLIVIENYLDGKRKAIIGKNCGSSFNGYCIDSISINNRQFYMRWFTDYEFDKPKNKRKTKTIKFKVNF